MISRIRFWLVNLMTRPSGAATPFWWCWVKLQFLVPLNMIHCLFRSVEHPMCRKRYVGCFFYAKLSGDSERKKEKTPRIQMAQVSTCPLKGFIFMIECWQGQSNGKCPFHFMTGRPQSKHQAFRAWIQEWAATTARTEDSHLSLVHNWGSLRFYPLSVL